MIRMMFCFLAVGCAAAAYAEKWIDGRELPLEGKAFADVESYYDRMPASAQATNTNACAMAQAPYLWHGLSFQDNLAHASLSLDAIL